MHSWASWCIQASNLAIQIPTTKGEGVSKQKTTIIMSCHPEHSEGSVNIKWMYTDSSRSSEWHIGSKILFRHTLSSFIGTDFSLRSRSSTDNTVFLNVNTNLSVKSVKSVPKRMISVYFYSSTFFISNHFQLLQVQCGSFAYWMHFYSNNLSLSRSKSLLLRQLSQ